jgi:hypothetical protein
MNIAIANAHGVYVTAEHKQTEWEYIEALHRLKTHCDQPTISTAAEPNRKKRKLLQYERGQTTMALKQEARETRRRWQRFVAENDSAISERRRACVL